MTKDTHNENPIDYDYFDDEEIPCWQCQGEGYGIVGMDWDSDDPINGPYNGDIQQCPCCNGSGLADDCTYW